MRALATLHEVLTKEQRAALVNATCARYAAIPQRSTLLPPMEDYPFAIQVKELGLTRAQNDAIIASLKFERARTLPGDLEATHREIMAKTHAAERLVRAAAFLARRVPTATARLADRAWPRPPVRLVVGSRVTVMRRAVQPLARSVESPPTSSWPGGRALS